MPEISKIKLPSGNVYDIKDAVARQMISGGVSFLVAWDGSSTPDPAAIPAGVKVVYNDTTYTGTLSADDAQAGAFYLVHSSTVTSEGPLDVYDEYVPVGSGSEKYWEKIGDTQVDLSNVVTNVTLNKSTTSVIGSNATLTTTKLYGEASGTNVSWDSKDQVTAVTGFNSKDQKAAVTGFNNKDQVSAVTGFNSKDQKTVLTKHVTADKTYIKASASGANTAWNSKDQKTAVTGYTPNTATLDTEDFVTSVTATSDKKLVTTSVTGVQSSTTTASKATQGTSQTTADGTDTRKDANASVLPADASANPSANDYILRRIGVNDEVLIIGSVELDTQTTTQYTFSDVTVPIKAASATTVATGATDAAGTGSSIVTGVTVGTTAPAYVPSSSEDSLTVVTGLGTPSTANVIGASSTFTITQPTVALATDETSATGRVQVATDVSAQSNDTATVVGTSATFTTDTVVGTDATFTTANVVGASATFTTDTVIGTDSTFTVTDPAVYLSAGNLGDVTVATGAFTSKDQKTVLDNGTSITTTFGGEGAQGIGNSEF